MTALRASSAGSEFSIGGTRLPAVKAAAAPPVRSPERRQGVQNKQLGAGDAMQVSESWQRHPAPGRYTAIATLNSSNYPLEHRVDFVVQ